MDLGRGTFDADTGAANAAGVLSLVGGRVRPAAGGDIPAIELRTTDGANWLARPLGYHPEEYSEDEQCVLVAAAHDRTHRGQLAARR